MSNERNQFWNQRYGNAEYVYGEDPNKFFASQIKVLKPGKIIFPCEGEGRNAVFAASLGWQVAAFDGSAVGQFKALQLAAKKAVFISYTIEDAELVQYPENSVDLVVFIFAHLPNDIRYQVHQKAISWLKPGGKIILEAFNPKQLANASGGPKDISMLYTEEMLRADFVDLNIELLQTIQTTLNEGAFHEGIANVIQFVGTKGLIF